MLLIKMDKIPVYLHNLKSIQENGINKKYRYSIDVTIYSIQGTSHYKTLIKNGRSLQKWSKLELLRKLDHILKNILKKWKEIKIESAPDLTTFSLLKVISFIIQLFHIIIDWSASNKEVIHQYFVEKLFILLIGD